jgi:hypothetical protein
MTFYSRSIKRCLKQQNLDGLRLAIIVLHSVTNQLEDLLPLVIGYRSRVGGDLAGNDRFDRLGTGTFSQRPTADLLRASIVRESSTMAQGRWIPEADLKGRLEQLGASYARRKAVQ